MKKVVYFLSKVDYFVFVMKGITPLVTKESMIEMLNDPKIRIKCIGRALVALLSRQVEDEKRSAETKLHNGLGFQPADAYSGTLTAKYFLKHKTLLDWQVEKWMKPTGKKGLPRLVKYSRQLNEIALEKSTRRSESTQQEAFI